ncbi:hypothetical protein [Streptomyces sp. Go-475]|uniref:hypothetical protein n=1 Tax=Streptomyces sp. Go-475 TaxID=2072505 RepID=UPI000DEFD2A6|nr:hypothetical protein [Streptomyces sp. Go-475]AXE86741.1 hypothetical protein C1703_17180 [Streptomyces sp. Go-475]
MFTSVGVPDFDAGQERTTPVGADVLDDWGARFVAQLAAPRAQRLSVTIADTTQQVLVDVEVGAWAALVQDGEHWIVRQGGPVRLWDAVGGHVLRWRASGSPALDRFQVTLTPEAQR